MNKYTIQEIANKVKEYKEQGKTDEEIYLYILNNK